MRLALLIYGDLTPRSGGYLYDLKLVEHLRANGHQVEVVSLPWRNYLAHLTDNFSSSLFERLRRLEVDLLLQDELNHPSLFVLNRRLRPQVAYPIVAIVHHLRSREPRAALNALYATIERRYLNRVDGFIFNSRTTQGVVESLLSRPCPSVVARPAGDRLVPRTSTAQITQRAEQPGPLRVAFVGALIRRKAPQLLIEALTRLPRGDFELHLAGSPAVEPRYAAGLRAYIAHAGLGEYVHLRGHLADTALADLLLSSHVLALPSAYEGYGIAYLEGMGFGLPAIGTRAGAAHELISHGKDGFLIPPGDAATLAAHLAALHTDRQMLARLGAAALARYRAHPTWEESMASARLFLEQAIMPSKSVRSPRRLS